MSHPLGMRSPTSSSAATALRALVQCVNLYQSIAGRVIKSPHNRGVASRQQHSYNGRFHIVRWRQLKVAKPGGHRFTWFCAIAGSLVNSNTARTDMAVTNEVMETRLWEIRFLLVVFGQAYKHNQRPSRQGDRKWVGRRSCSTIRNAVISIIPVSRR
jgi:hypothetical protein